MANALAKSCKNIRVTGFEPFRWEVFQVEGLLAVYSGLLMNAGHLKPIFSVLSRILRHPIPQSNRLIRPHVTH